MPSSPQQFLEALTHSGLLTAADLAALRTEAPTQDGAIIAAELVNQRKLTPYQASMLSQGQSGGLVFGEYTVLDKLGEGGMGVVYKAQHRRLKRTVALKVLSPTLTKDEHLVKRFHREVEAAARLSHPNIALAYDANEQDGTHYLVVEFVDGPDLARLVRERGPLPVPTAIDYLTQAAAGLAHAHAKGIVHRDIKPSNLLVDKDGTVKILDMGLARFTDAGGSAHRTSPEGLTHTGHIMGTFEFMAPEQAVDTRRADERSDIYSLGCTLYYLLAGEPPYAGESGVMKLMAHREQPIPSLRAARPEAPVALNVIFQRMLAKKPEDRFQSMAEVRRALKAIDRKPRPAKRRDRQTRDDRATSVPVAGLADSEILAAITKDAPRKPTVAAQALGVLFALVALAAITVVTVLTLVGIIRPPMDAAVPFLYVAAAGLFVLGMRFVLGGTLDLSFLGTLAGGLVGAMGGAGMGFFFAEMSQQYPGGVMVGAILGLGAGLILRLRWVGTLICGLAASAAAYMVGWQMNPFGDIGDKHSLLGALGFLPVGALIGTVLAHRTLREQLKGDGKSKSFWAAP
jgi:serine/threonine protein kinase